MKQNHLILNKSLLLFSDGWNEPVTKLFGIYSLFACSYFLIRRDALSGDKNHKTYL